MRIEQHLSKHLSQWHCHLYMTKEELEKQPKTHITNVIDLYSIVGLSVKDKMYLNKLFMNGILYIELKVEQGE